MADQTTPPQGQPQTQSGGQLLIEVQNQYVKDLSFENPGAAQAPTPGAEPQLTVNVNVGGERRNDNLYEVVLNLHAEARQQDRALYVLELAYAGMFRIEGPEGQHAPAVLIEGPRLLFPFARELVATITRNGGYMPLLLNPIDFVGLYRQRLQQLQAQKTQGTA